MGISLCINADSKPPTIQAAGRILDHLPKYNNNFQPPNCGAMTKGLVKSQLGPSRVPELVNLDPDNQKNEDGRMITPSLFETFFAYRKDINIDIPYNLTLNYDSDRNIYTFDSQTFFPIDNQGWDKIDPSNKIYQDGDGNYHNFHFCMVSHMFFTYQGYEVFNFRGDDDVWVFINSELAVDLGGLHSAETGNVNLQTGLKTKLTIGNTYPLDFFYCERCTTTSTLKLETNIQVFCASYDYCGICNGDGSSCCNAAVDCNDGNSCTTDICPKPRPGITKQNFKDYCEHPPITCAQTDSCFKNGCSNGKCVVTSEPLGCPTQSCKDSTCLPNTGCKYTPHCPNTDKCLNVVCVPGNGIKPDSCSSTKVNCDKGDLCTDYSCDSVKGCISSPKNCAANSTDTNMCNQHYCEAGVCKVRQLPPTECQCCQGQTVNKCQVSKCDSTSGKCIISDNPLIDDGDKCTVDTCDANGVITHTKKVCSGCQSCDQADGVCKNADTNCDDFNKCTIDSCVTNSTQNVCQFKPTDCDDKDPCTDDLCDPVQGCLHTPTVCPGVGDCAVGVCVPNVGCSTKPRDCSTGVFCTDSICIEGTGCANFTRNCVGSDPKCKKGTCNIEKQECEYSDYSPKPFGCNKAAIISTGVIAGIVVAGAVALAIMVFGGKKGYDYWKNHQEQKISNLNSNPLYTVNPNSGNNPLFQEN
ncbi:PA14 domain-containing protein [Heterostelium album PN500]|uniref:PA14 domain-containing protein n=1 Tax=Heterostelium pallidum (strain ATCC 26659 / Pp 5 / PN500) TaxID=670386 RepID=D3BQX6_HETP5|nr:PA14 domain-containing protein [Heterostelium album PN500]EFA76162.1 PA14 domain-containing protein [Heterostelium album PN500]|eukprot:XP_020428296.1 PA14 domain-containing protein [Heterostelium album PN500]